MNTKTDVRQLPFGEFPLLVNVTYDTDKELKKRNGFDQLTFIGAIPNTLTTFSDALTALTPTSLYSYQPEVATWQNKGTYISANFEVQPVVRSATNQSEQDAAVDSTGLACVVWKDSDGNSKYQIVDSANGNIVVAGTSLPTAGAQARAFVLGNYFIITFITSTPHLQYIAIPRVNPSNPGSAIDLATDIGSTTAGYDGYVSNGALYIAYTTVTPSIKVFSLNSALVQTSPKTIASRTATYMSVTADATNQNIWLTYWDTTNSNLYGAAFDGSLNVVRASTVLKNDANIVAVASTATGGVLKAYYEDNANYGYAIPGASGNAITHFVSTVSCTAAGVVSGDAVLNRGVALASKAFIANSVSYVMLVYGSNSVNNQNFQPTYFLVNSSGKVVGRLASTNAGGYPTSQVLANANIDGDEIQIAYLFKDLLTSVNKNLAGSGITFSGPNQISGIYSQTGVNLVKIMLDPQQVADTETASNLHLTGGMMWGYDGQSPWEHGFNVWPEDIGYSWTDTPVTPTGTWSNASTSIVVSSASGVAVGMAISDTSNSGYIVAGTVITAINGTTLTISTATTHSAAGDNLSISGSMAGQPDGATNTNAYCYQVTYEWTDAQGNLHRSAPSVPLFVTTSGSADTGSVTLKIPTYRLTYRTANKVRIVVYRWSIENQIFYQVTSVSSPTLNNPAVDSITYVDPLSDSSIVGNQIIYTNGNVVENICAPACLDVALMRSRLFLIDSEDQNVLWYSKQVIQNVPVEMSDVFTLFVNPTVGAQGSTGPMKCIAAMDDKLIIFKQNALYYMTGVGPDNAGNNNDFSDPIFINSTVGSSNIQSIVFIPQGLMFQSDKGIWLLGRDLSTNYIGAPVEAYNNHLVVSAINVPGTNTVKFTLDNGMILMYDYYYNRWAVHQSVSGLGITSTIYAGLHTYSDDLGQVFQETPGEYLDGTSPVLIGFTTGWLNLNGLQGYQRAYWCLFLGQYITPHKLSVGVAYDYNPAIVDQALVLPDNFSEPYGDDAGSYGDVGPYGGPGDPELVRTFFSRQRSQAIQLTVQEIYDPSYGIAAGAGLTLSGLSLVVGAKKSFRPSKAAQSFGSTGSSNSTGSDGR